MSDSQQQTTQTTTLTRAGLDALHRELGEKAHLVHELMAQLTACRADLEQAKQLLGELQERYGPAANEANGTAELVDALAAYRED